MSRGAGRRGAPDSTRSRAARAGAALALLLLPVLAAAPAAGSQPAPRTTTASPAAEAAEPEPESPVAVEVSTLAPRAPQPGGRLQVKGTLTNTGSSPVERLRVSLRVGDRLSSRSALELADEEGSPTRRVPGSTVTLAGRPLPPGGTRTFDVSSAVEDLGLQGDGAYPLEVEVRGRIDGGSSGEIVGLVGTFLPWFAEPPTGTTRIAFVWPLVAPPVQAPRRTQEGSVLLDDDLAVALGREGRLERALRAARFVETGQCDTPAAPVPGEDAPARTATCRREPVPVTYALDADLLETARGMAGGYRVRLSERRLEPGTGGDAARTFLASLRAGVAAGDVVALPYADIDVVALTALGSGLAADVGPALQLGRTVVAQLAGADPLPSMTLAPPGRVTGDALQAYVGTGTRTLVLAEDALPPRPPRQGRTSGARNPVSTAAGPVDGLVIDDGLSRLLAPDTGGERWQGPRLAEQRWLVESAMVAAEQPDATRTLLVAPARDAELVPAVAAQAMLDAGRLPWLCPVPLADVLTGTERCPAGGPVGSADEQRGAPLPPAEDAPLLEQEQLDLVAEARRDVDQLTGAVLAPSDAAEATEARLLRAGFRAESQAWRGSASGRRLARLLQEDVGDLLGKVTLLTGPVTLTSSSGQVTVDVENQLDQAVTVRVQIVADNAARLAVAAAGEQTVPPRTSVPLSLQAEPRTSGQFPVRARLLDRRGDPFGEPSEFVLRSTRYGSVALAVTGVGAGVLLAAAGYRLFRRAVGR